MSEGIWVKHGPGKRLLQPEEYNPDIHELVDEEKPKRRPHRKAQEADE